MKKYVIAALLGTGAVAAIGAGMLTAPASAQLSVFDPTNYTQNLLTAARTLQQINNQIQSLQNEAQMLVNQGKNLSRIDFPQLDQQVYPYSDGTLYRLYAAPERITDIALQPGEAVTSVAAGDTVRWTVGDTTSGSGADQRTHIFVKPYSAGLRSNLVITTDKRVYHIELESRSTGAMAALSWTYPKDELIALRRQQDAAAAAAPIASGFAVDRLNFHYAISGDKPAWRPLRAFDDGRQTFIEFPPSIAVGEAPPLFVIGDDGEAQLVNYRVAGRYYVVDRLFGSAELRLGGKKQQVVRISTAQPKRRKGK